ncbi:MAG: hypothetical protein LBQ37_01210 [Elusimicrobiota bacterium]|jgi:phosphoribosylanthranilate isomerase|nr:hypothetical protein [Elusimicrobiota bacterium]
MAKIKICGLTNYNDVLQATNLGADFLGFHFIKESPKKISEKALKEYILKLPPFVIPVGVFLNADKISIEKVLKKTGLKNIQLNGDESPQMCEDFKNAQIKVFKYFKIENDESIFAKIETYIGKIDYLVLDFSYSEVEGEERKYNFELPIKVQNFGIPFFLSEVKIENIKTAIDKILPFGIDLDCQIERLVKRKDYDKMSKAIKLSHGLKG